MFQDAQYSMAEVARHNQLDDCWIVIDDIIYDVSKFIKMHPGGEQVLLKETGKEVTELFKLYHNPGVLQKYGSKLRIGTLDPPVRKRKMQLPGTFGQMIPYGDPLWYQRFKSPYYRDSHKKWRSYVRNFVDEHILSSIHRWMNKSRPPADLMLKMGSSGLLAACTGKIPWSLLPPEVAALIPKDFDAFHELILHDELGRCGNSGVFAALTNGVAIALPAVLNFGSKALQQQIAPDVLLGKKYIALAISEPQAGSDVAGLSTTATREGDVYVVNGNKKWITNGTYADYFVTAVRTGGKGHGGISFLLIEADLPGFDVRKLNVRASAISGTAYLTFNNCRVSANNLMGKENKGFKLIMFNFNHERFYIIVVCMRMARVCLEECIKYATRRETFGKKIHEHQVVRNKIAKMAGLIEPIQSMLELVAYQFCTMSPKEANLKLGDVLSLLKAQASKVYEQIARETTHVFGGNSMLVGGVGGKIEGSVMQVKGYAIPGGAEDILEDYAARTIFKLTSLTAHL